MFNWAQTELPLWSPPEQTCLDHETQAASRLRALPAPRTLFPNFWYRFRDQLYASLLAGPALHCHQERMIPGPHVNGRRMQK